MDTHELLKLTNITKSFPGMIALNNVDLSLKKGEVISLVGENGAGKSTLMSIIGGVYTPDAGEIVIEGERVKIENPSVARKYGIGYVHQEPTLAPNMTATENLFLGQERTKLKIITNRKLMLQKANQILEEIGISFDPEKLVSEMTMAEKEAVEIAKTMLQRPKILILDEVTAPLDNIGAEHLFQIIKKLRASGIGIIYISHRLREVFEISDKIFVLRDGKEVRTLEPQNTSQEKIIKLMVGEENTFNFSNRKNDHCAPGKELLRCENFSKKNAFRKISLNLNANEIIGLAGLKGAGRSKLAKALFGLEKAEEGTIFINGEKIEIKNPFHAIKAGIGYIPADRQQEGLALIRNVEENITITLLKVFSLIWNILKRGKTRKIAMDVVHKLRVKPASLKNTVANLSGGNQQKVMIGKWLIQDRAVLIFEEPTRGVDVKSKAEIHDLLIELKKQGKGMIIISSDLPELVSICSRILVMEQGELINEFDGNECTEEQILRCMHVDSAMI